METFVRDETCVHTLASSHIRETASRPGAKAEMAGNGKR
ncbi:jg27146, partial [Pararge aegeria aegeria]